MAAPILCHFGFVCKKTFMPIKFLVLGGGIWGFGFFGGRGGKCHFGGGGSANFIFMGARIFLKNGPSPRFFEKLRKYKTNILKVLRNILVFLSFFYFGWLSLAPRIAALASLNTRAPKWLHKRPEGQRHTDLWTRYSGPCDLLFFLMRHRDNGHLEHFQGFASKWPFSLRRVGKLHVAGGRKSGLTNWHAFVAFRAPRWGLFYLTARSLIT